MLRSACSAALASVSIASAQHQALRIDPASIDGVVPYRGPVEAPDVMGGWASGHIIVLLRPGATPREALAEISQIAPGLGDRDMAPVFDPPPLHADLARRFALDRYYFLALDAGQDAAAVVRQINEHLVPGSQTIERAELDGIGGILQTPNDPSFSRQYGLHNTGQTVEGVPGVPDADIDAPEAWDISVGSASVIVAVIDTGVSNSHPDLTANRIGGWNTIDDNTDTDDSWLISHGTHCAGIIGAVGNNARGVTGVNWDVSIMPVKVLNWLGAGTESDVAQGIQWAADHGADVASLSLGFSGRSSVVDNAVAYADAAGVLVVAASGNDPNAPIGSPAAAPEAMAVGATDNRDQIASFTTTGPQMSVTAPGVDVYSTYDTLFDPNTYSYLSGTSMACPHVSGLGALIKSVDSGLTNHEIREIIESTADDKGAPGWDETFGFGRINAHAALLAAVDPGCPADIDGNGVLDAGDFFAFLDMFASNDPDADLTGNGIIDVNDFFAFLDLFAAGC